MGKFKEDATELLAAIGGKENIAAVSHCITRMRYVLVDPKIADIMLKLIRDGKIDIERIYGKKDSE